jgi:hypothetical protein
VAARGAHFGEETVVKKAASPFHISLVGIAPFFEYTTMALACLLGPIA